MSDWKKIFKDSNDFNEKSIIGFIAFSICMVVIFLDVVFTISGKHFEINKIIYDSLVWIVIGCFGISGVQKFANKN
tara:strand:+ start:149 stop:376 length:228 start_codon:yes stop_codon:yes gene_type:complete